MNSVVRSLVLRVLRRREVSDRLQRPAAAAAGNKNKQAAAGYSTDRRLAAYRYRTDGGYLLVPLVAFGAATWLVATAATRYVMTPKRQGTKTTTTVVEGRRTPEVAAASPPSD